MLRVAQRGLFLVLAALLAAVSLTARAQEKSVRPGIKMVVIDFKRVKGESTDWVMNHVRAGQEVFTREILTSGFKLVDESRILKENYFLRFEKVK